MFWFSVLMDKILFFTEEFKGIMILVVLVDATCLSLYWRLYSCGQTKKNLWRFNVYLVKLLMSLILFVLCFALSKLGYLIIKKLRCK